MELPNLPFNHAFSEDLQETLWHFKGQGNETGTKAGGDNQGSVNLILFQQLQPRREQFVCSACTGRRDKMLRNTFLHKIIGCSERDIQRLGQFPLCDSRILEDRTADDDITIHDEYLRD